MIKPPSSLDACLRGDTLYYSGGLLLDSSVSQISMGAGIAIGIAP